MENKLELILESSPHLKSNDSTPRIMYMVILLLLPISAVGIYYFGWAALLRIVTGVAAAVATEFVFL